SSQKFQDHRKDDTNNKELYTSNYKIEIKENKANSNWKEKREEKRQKHLPNLSYWSVKREDKRKDGLFG
ncbi:25928_t:CDS:2, partial [Gigaspora margarita]